MEVALNTLEINTKDTGIYGRQSIDKKDSVSIETQLDKNNSTCALNNWGIYKEYYDKGFSGKDIDRPRFQELLRDIELGYIKRVVVYRLDRISRSITDFANLLTFFEKYNVTFVSATENFDTSTPLGRAMIFFIMIFAQLERETIAERITDNYYFRAKQGLFCGGGVPYGFSGKKIVGSDGKKKSILEINDEEIQIVKKIYDLYLNEKGSIRKVVSELNSSGIKPRNKKLWSSNQISRILTRPIYTSNSPALYNYYSSTNINIIDSLATFDGTKSLTIIGKETGNGKYRKYIDISDQFLVTVDIPATIEDNIWLKVQNKMKNNKQFAPRTGQSNVCFLSGLLYCGRCSYSMSFKTEKKKNKQYNYICCNTKKNRGYNICDSTLYRVEEVENAVLSHLINYLKDSNIYSKLLELKEPQKIDVELINRKNILEAKITEHKKEIHNLLQVAASTGTVASTYIKSEIENIDSKITTLKVELDKINTKIYNQSSAYDKLSDIQQYLQNPDEITNYDFDTKKQICKSFIKKIILNFENINIEYIL